MEKYQKQFIQGHQSMVPRDTSLLYAYFFIDLLFTLLSLYIHEKGGEHTPDTKTNFLQVIFTVG